MRSLRYFILSISLASIMISNVAYAKDIRFFNMQESNDISKKWKINFSENLIRESVNNKNIYVTDIDGKFINSDPISKENKSIEITPPNEGYKYGETYFININEGLKSDKGDTVTREIKVPFIIRNKDTNGFKLGNERLISNYKYLIDGKRVGLITNKTGVNSKGVSTIDVLSQYKGTKLTALYGPEHGIDGKAKAGEYVMSYEHPTLKIPVYSLYGDTRRPTQEMLSNVDILIFDIQDIGARSYTYMSTLNYCIEAASKYNKPIVVLDRPNPLGGLIMDGPVIEDKFKTFVGVDNMPMTHGMTAGELAKFFNRKFNADVTVIPMEGYKRNMIFQDTGLNWVQTSPMIPDVEAAFCYGATGLGEGTGISMDDYFKWVGGKEINSSKFAKLLNEAGLPGVEFIAKPKNKYVGGVTLKITDYHSFNPAKTGIYVLAYAKKLSNFEIPKSGKEIVMFDKIMGTDKIGQFLDAGYTPQQIEERYKEDLENFKQERKKYLIYD